LIRVAIIDDYIDIARTLVDWSPVDALAEVDVFKKKFSDDDEAAQALADFDIICTLRERSSFDARLLSRLPRLKYIAVTGMRFDAIDVVAATRLGIVVSNSEVTRGGGGVSELAWGLVIATARHIAHEDASIKSGGWQSRLGFTLKGKTIGVVGLGRIGSRMAAYANAFEMRVLTWSPNMTAERAADQGAVYAPLETLLADSDVVTLHIPLSASTRGLIGAAELSRMKKSAVLINTSRAGLVDQPALIDALTRGLIGGAGLDVFEAEPLPTDDPIRHLANAVLTPHIGYYTSEMLTVYYEDAVEAIVAFIKGRPIRVVNPEVLVRPR
jgi:D-3-phosphoglycerate dehydrogenase